MIVLSIPLKEAEKAALGVAVTVSVFVAGTSEKGVGEGSNVKVGNKVGVSVNSAGCVAVHVASG